MVNEGIELDVGLDSDTSTYDNTSKKQQIGSSSSRHVADAKRTWFDKVFYDKENVAIGPSYDNNILTEVHHSNNYTFENVFALEIQTHGHHEVENCTNVNREAQQVNESLTKQLEIYDDQEKHFTKETITKSNICKKIKLLNNKISNLKSQACKKERSFHKENEKYADMGNGKWFFKPKREWGRERCKGEECDASILEVVKDGAVPSVVDMMVEIEKLSSLEDTTGKYGLVRSMFSSSTGLFSFQFSSMDGLDAMLENGPCYARAMIELRADKELKDNIVVAMPKINGEGHYTCNIRVEPVPKKHNANSSGNKKKGVDSTNKRILNVKNSSTSTIPIMDKIGKIENLVIDGQAILVDEVEMTGFGTQSLLEQWRDSYGNGDYN
ncbi:hypothetical protein Tco_0695247 [Tanacetum coccineum]